MENFKVQQLPISFDFETKKILKSLNRASRALGELKGDIKKIPNSEILLDTLALQEAKDSSEIENIITTDDEMYQAMVDDEVLNLNAKEVKNYAFALKTGYNSIQKKGIITINDIIKIQEIVSPNHPIRKLPGTNLKNAKTNEIIYTPPQNHDEIILLLSNLEKYINDETLQDLDGLIKMAIIHYQFETIHPFYDGNGRTGRILNILYLVQQKLLDIPVLYLSHYITNNKIQYYALLQNIRTDNKWEDWIIWMLNGVEETAIETLIIVNKIKDLMDLYKKQIKEKFTFYSHDLINLLFKHPYTKIDFLERELKIHRNTASAYLNQLVDANLLRKTKIGKTNYYINEPLMQILKDR
jgi:Fic family protein